jgi:hypothetical protein
MWGETRKGKKREESEWGKREKEKESEDEEREERRGSLTAAKVTAAQKL